MEHLSDILLVQAIFLAAVMTPGPDFVVVSTTALSRAAGRASQPRRARRSACPSGSPPQ
jgi:threonine/homoserine/homoserine lactone efflux protein